MTCQCSEVSCHGSDECPAPARIRVLTYLPGVAFSEPPKEEQFCYFCSEMRMRYPSEFKSVSLRGG